VLRAAAAAYGAGIGVWTFAYEAGLAVPSATEIPTVSVGGLTVGGSGKTPFAAELCRLLSAAGERPAVVTRGYPDELSLHEWLGRDWPVVGHPERGLAVREAAGRGATVAVLDDGFQHRRLDRSLDIVLLDADLVGRVAWRLLPAGPFREPPAALTRADVVVVTRRAARVAHAAAVARWARGVSSAPVLRCALEPDGVEPARPAGGPRSPGGPEVGVAVAGVMKPEPFLASVREVGLRPRLEVILSDHGTPDPALLEAIEREAADSGLVTTWKDALRLLPLLSVNLRVWCLRERLTWEEGRGELLERLDQVADGEGRRERSRG